MTKKLPEDNREGPMHRLLEASIRVRERDHWAAGYRASMSPAFRKKKYLVAEGVHQTRKPCAVVIESRTTCQCSGFMSEGGRRPIAR